MILINILLKKGKRTNEVQKQLQLHDLGVGEYLTDKSSVRGRDLPLFTMVTFVLSAESLFSVQNHCYQCRIIVLIKGVLFLNDHGTQRMVWEVPSSLNMLFDVEVWKIPVYHPALVVNFYRVNLESLITLLIDI